MSKKGQHAKEVMGTTKMAEERTCGMGCHNSITYSPGLGIRPISTYVLVTYISAQIMPGT